MKPPQDTDSNNDNAAPPTDDDDLICDPQTTRLVFSAQGGDREALESLCKRYLPRVRTIVAMKLGRSPRQLAQNEDIVQEAFVKILRSLDTYRKLSKARFYHFVSRCVVNLIRDTLRRDRTRPAELPLDPSPEQDDPVSAITRFVDSNALTASQRLDRAEFERVIDDALLALPEHWREIVNLHCFCGMSHAEIATTLGFEKEGTVRQYLFRARGLLTKEIEGRLSNR